MKPVLYMPSNKLEDTINLACKITDAFDKFGWKVGAEAFGIHFQLGRILVIAMENDAEEIEEICILQYRHRWYEDPDQRGAVVLRYEGEDALKYAKKFSMERGMNWFEYQVGNNFLGEKKYIREQLVPVIGNGS